MLCVWVCAVSMCMGGAPGDGMFDVCFLDGFCSCMMSGKGRSFVCFGVVLLVVVWLLLRGMIVMDERGRRCL